MIVQCQCGKRLDVPAEFAGKNVRCPSCQQAVSVPADLPVASVAPTAPFAPPPPPSAAGGFYVPTPGTMSKGFFVGSLVACLGVSIIINLFMLGAKTEATAGVCAVLNGIVSLYQAVVMFIFIYAMWKALQNASPSMTPGQAIGFMFIPGFNIYWYIRVLGDWAKVFNLNLKRKGLDLAPAPEGLFLATVALSLTSTFCVWMDMGSWSFHGLPSRPYVMTMIPRAIMIASTILTIIVAEIVCDRVNALATAQK